MELGTKKKKPLQIGNNPPQQELCSVRKTMQDIA